MDQLIASAEQQIGLARQGVEVTLYANTNQTRRALADLAEGLRAWRLWTSLGWQDIRLRYTRSVLGPFWMTLSMLVLIIGIGTMYAGLFGTPTQEYVPYVAIGIIVWGFISTCINEGCTAFFSQAGTILQIPAPLSIYAYRVVWRTFINFLHNVVIYVGIALFFGIWAGVENIWFAALGMAVLCLNGTWASIFFGLLSARFRDIPLIVASFVQVTFFLTPVFWRADQVSQKNVILKYNPFVYYLDIVRRPLLGETSQLRDWAVVLSLTILGCVLSMILLVLYRRRIAYWV